jgi:agmatinase
MTKIVKVPGVNGLGKTEGAREGANLICGGFNCEKIELDSGNIEEQEKRIYEKAKKEFGEGERCVFIGGDHSISYSTTRAFFERYRQGCLVIFDAHVDCMENLKEPTHEEWLRGVIEERSLKGNQVLLIGVRRVEKEEKEFLEKKGIGIMKVEEFDLERVKEFISGRKCYLSFDVDVFDPKVLDSTGYLEEGGFGEELFGTLEELGKMEEIKGFDIVELHVDNENSGNSQTFTLRGKASGKGNVERGVEVSKRVVKSFI